MRVLSILLIFFISSCSVGTLYEFDNSSDMKEVEVYSDGNVVIYVNPLIGRRSLIRIFSLKDDIDVNIESIGIVVYGDGKELVPTDNTVLPGARVMDQNYSYEMVKRYEVVELPKSIHGQFHIKIRINGIEYKKEHEFSMHKNNVGYFEALQSI